MDENNKNQFTLPSVSDNSLNDQAGSNGSQSSFLDDPVVSSPTQNTQQFMATQTPMIADDVDLIEKEWVEKAKEIVRNTQGDPYNQNKQINQVKADYLKKRYDKDIKVAE